MAHNNQEPPNKADGETPRSARFFGKFSELGQLRVSTACLTHVLHA
jgi:hypothetical protein